MKKGLLFVMLGCLLATPAFAATFTNGGFETGDLTGWTEGGGSWGGTSRAIHKNFTGSTTLPTASDYNGGLPLNTIVGIGTDPITGQSTVYNGNYAVRVNNNVNDYTTSTIKQSVTNYTDTDIYFEWNAVLEDSHDLYDSDYFSLTLTDDTTNSVLFSRFYSSASAPGIFTAYTAPAGIFGTWYGSGWQVEHIDLNALGIVGHDFTLALLGSDCPYGGHAGYVYLDGFAPVIVPPTQGVPEPATMLLLGGGLIGIGIARKKISA